VSDVIGFEEVTVSYGSVAAVSALSEQIDPGEWVGLIGPNGAGKTSLLRSVVRLVPHDGRVTVGDDVVASLAPKRLARLVAYVPQEPELPPGMTVGDYVLLGRTPHLGYLGFEGAGDRAVCGELLEGLELGSMATRRLGTLSGGELQRLVLARALAQEAPVLVLDEPTSALDLGHRVHALELVDELRRARGLTVLSAMHDLTLAGQFADRLILLAQGRVAAVGKPDEVLTEQTLSAHFATSVRVLRTADGQLVVAPERRTP